MTEHEAKSYRVDRSEFGSGAWDSEPDRLDFEYAGFPCLLLRNHMGVWCGYVGLPEGHPCYGLKYHDVDVDVHGGLTYSNQCQGAICHVAKPGESDARWWLGFDLGHAFDLVPAFTRLRAEFRAAHPAPPGYEDPDVYRTIDYAREQTEHLAEQMALKIAP